MYACLFEKDKGHVAQQVQKLGFSARTRKRVRWLAISIELLRAKMFKSVHVACMSVSA